MRRSNWLGELYLLNLALLFTHEIDSAFWREWELFGIPGGIQVFLLLNFVLLLVALYGFRQVLFAARGAAVFSLLLAAGGLLAFALHSYFIVTGHPQFMLPMSMLILLTILVVSLAQLVATVMAGRGRRPHFGP